MLDLLFPWPDNPDERRGRAAWPHLTCLWSIARRKSVVEQSSYEGWAIVECLGHRVLSGRVQAVPLLGSQALRIDVALPESEPPFSEFLMPAAIYGIAPCLQEEAEAWAAGNLEVLRGLGLRSWPEAHWRGTVGMGEAVRATEWKESTLRDWIAAAE